MDADALSSSIASCAGRKKRSHTELLLVLSFVAGCVATLMYWRFRAKPQRDRDDLFTPIS